MGFKIKARYVVKPAEPTWNGILPLTELDQIGDISLTPFLYFYKNTAIQESYSPLDGNKETILKKLLDSLSHALVPFYPLAGRLHWIGEGRLELECNSMGVQFIDAESALRISDFGDFSSSHSMFQNFIPDAGIGTGPLNDVPLLVVQLTRFRCGGVGLCIRLSHVVIDGRSASHFIDEWARLSRGEPLGGAPYMDRQALQATAEGVVPSDALVKAVVNHPTLIENEVIDSKDTTCATFALTKFHVDRLKEVANKGTEPGCPPTYYSRFQVVAAHIWRCVSKARSHKTEQPTSLFFMVDSRSRLDPPLPSRYFGNAIILAPAFCQAAGELISKPLSDACNKVREAIEKVNNKYVLSTMAYLKMQQSLSNFQDHDGLSGFCNPNLMMVSWLNIQVEDKDFGWGKEIYVGRGPRACDGDILILPGQDNDGSVLVDVCLPVAHMEEFKKYLYQDVEFKG